MWSTSKPARIISTVPTLQILFARALSSSSTRNAYSGRSSNKSSIFDRPPSVHRLRGGRDADGSSGSEFGRPVDLRFRAQRRTDDGRGRSYGMSANKIRNDTSGEHGSSRRLAALNNGDKRQTQIRDSTSRLDSGPKTRSDTKEDHLSKLSYARPSSAASPTDARPVPFRDLALPDTVIQGLRDVLGEEVTMTGNTTPIQTLSFQNLLSDESSNMVGKGTGWVLGAETGSGKTLAYMVPLMHHLKTSEQPESDLELSALPLDMTENDTCIRPRSIVLSPTHELTRQSTSVAKLLSHSIKLRVKGLSSTRWGSVDAGAGIDVLLGTTGSMRKMMGISREGVQWSERYREKEKLNSVNKGKEEMFEEEHGEEEEVRGQVGRTGKGEPKLKFDKVEWLVIDEADVLLGPDFITETQALIAALPPTAHIILTTATLPPSLLSAITSPSSSLSSRSFTHLISPRMHRLPSGLSTRFIGDTGGNLAASVVSEVKKSFEEDNLDLSGEIGTGPGVRMGTSKAVVFCNSDNRVRQMARKFEEKGLMSLIWTSAGVEDTAAANNGAIDPKANTNGKRQRGKQGDLSAFLSTSTNRISKPTASSLLLPLPSSSSSSSSSPLLSANSHPNPKDPVRVLITTSLLSRGLDFSSDITTVILVDPPRDALDFVHRAGRTARAGRKGRVIVFGMGGRGDVSGYQQGGRGPRGQKGKGRLGEEVSQIIRKKRY